MSATIFRHEFFTRLKSILTWSVSLVGLVFFFISIFQSFAEQAALLNEMLAKFPPALLEAFGMAKTDLSSVLGYYSFLFVFIQLCLAIQAGNYGFGLVSIEENELTADFLFSKPVSRFQIITSKLLAALSSLLLTDLAVTASTFIAISIFAGNRPYNTGTLSLLLVSMLILQLFFLTVGMAISLLVHRVRSVTPYSLALGFGSYILAAFSGIFGDIKLEYITPFKQLDAADIVLHNAYNTPLLLINLAITVVALVVSYVLYLRRDIPTAS
jgi:ABC-2 type transport system permease protein